MNFFKCLFILFTIFITQSIFAQCEPEVNGVFESNLSDPPYTICATHPNFGLSKCVMDVYTMQKNPSTGIFTLFAKTTGSECQSVTQLNKPKQYTCTSNVCPATEADICPPTHKKGMYNDQLSCVKKSTDTLECTSDSCPNPNQQRCPPNYYSGSIDDEYVCYKRTESTETDYEVSEESEYFDIVSSVNNAKNSIVDSIYSLSDTLSTNFNSLLAKLSETNSNGSQDSEDTENNGNDNIPPTPPDLSGFDVDVPHYELKENSDFQLKQNNFSSNAVCPPNKVLNLHFLNRSFTYTFSFATICNGLQIIGYFILIMCYLYSVNILVRV